MPAVTGTLLGAFVLCLVAGTGLALSAALRVRTAAELFVATYVVGFAAVVGLTLFLSAFDALTRTALVVGSSAFLVASIGVWLFIGTPRPPAPKAASVRSLLRPGPVVVLLAVVAVAVGYVLALLLGTPPNGWDPLNYHLARAAFWLESNSAGYLENAYDERLNFNPPNGEIAVSFVLGVTRHEVSAGVVQLSAAFACVAGVFAFARRLALNRLEAAFGALLFFLLPIVLLQASTTKNDLVVASFLVAASVFVLGESRRELVLASLATALAVGTKFTGAYGLVVLVALALLGPPRRRFERIAALGVGAILGSYWYAVNFVESGQLLGDQRNTPGLTAPLQPAENLFTAFGLAVDTIDLSGARGTDILLYILVALAVAAGFLVPGRISWRSAVLAASLVGSPLLLYPLSTEVGRPALLELYEVLESPQAYLAEGYEIASSPTIASDTGSWFGPAGLVLAIGVGVATTVLVRRRSLPRLAVVPAVAPLVFFVIISLSLTYHPWQGRFFIYPLALSASLWGLGLRVPVVAWGVTALATTTALLSLIHFDEKPSGLRLLDRVPTISVWTSDRWEVQSRHDPPLAPILEFMDRKVRADDSIALALGPNEFGYPAFGPRLSRRVELVPFGSDGVDVRTTWLLANPERAVEIDPGCWREEFSTETGTVFKRQLEVCGP